MTVAPEAAPATAPTEAPPEAPEAPREAPPAEAPREAPTRWRVAPADGAALDGHAPSGPITELWDRHRFDMKLINPANRRKNHVIVVGSGLAGAAAAASLGELGYRVSCFCYQDSPRRAHSIAAQG
ncbi:MAG: succinate dehydrogenase / fumarate reductase, flavoprotein subunit, partial [Acidimicrobiaceae bacterium]|nr:succinate dehydrogenase / fumarate reductase, flavoprotein subunit [Acidimicrobiaceae bacterium]